MTRLLPLSVAVGLMLAAAAVASRARTETPPAPATAAIVATAADKNPWTGLTPNADPDQFQFAIVSDRTGGHRRGVFSKAVQQINLLQPEFVVSVGDLIEGKTTADANRTEWDEFDGYVRRLQMPFFYVPGNHDAMSKVKADVWTERLGRRYYHFTYKGCLFLVLNAYDEEGTDPAVDDNYKKVRVGKAQQEYVENALKENAAAKWTFVFIHPPVWAQRDFSATGWLDVEKLLAGRPYTVFAGHLHTYRKYLRNGMNYYQLATTGGGSAMRGVEYGEFDQVAWVTVKKGKPLVANVVLSGVQNDTLTPFESAEEGKGPEPTAGQVPVTGTATLRGAAAAGLQVTFTEIKAGDAAAKAATGSARVTADGTFAVYGTRGVVGLPPGRYAVTFDLAQPLVIDGKPRDNPVAERYRSLAMTPFRVDVTADGRNQFTFAME